MSLHDFLLQLPETGRVRVSRDGGDAEDPGADAALYELDANARLEMTFDPPVLSLTAARWAALQLYRGCRFLTYRDIPAEVVRRGLLEPCPDPPGPAVCYSVDLALRHLPELFDLARGLARDDPLVECVRRLGGEWPLSSVGIPDIGPVDPAVFLGEPSLRTLYADRILERKDTSRLSDPDTKAAVREAIGIHGDLAPEISAVLAKEDTDD